MKNRTRIVYNCFYPEFDNGYDEPIVARNLRSAKRWLLRWGWYGWISGSIVRVVRHPLANLAQARWEPRDPYEFDYHVISRRKRKASSPLSRTDRAYYARNMKCSRPEIVRQDALDAAKRKAEEEAWELAHPVPLGRYPLPLSNAAGTLPDPQDIPF